MIAYLAIAAALGAAADAPPARIYESRTGEPTTIDAMADELARRDVVFLGEDHDNAAGHRLQLQIIEALYERRPDLVLSFEMFERDVQGVLDDYLRGRIDEETFKENARPWSRYDRHYRPIVEFARKRNLDAIAANVPRRVARAVSAGEEPEPADRPFLPRTTTAPQDAYRQRFVDVMQEHGGVADDPQAMDRYYRAQCLKDDAMAEAITDYLACRPHRRPLIVHLCGKFHSDYGGGTALRVLLRRPLSQLGVVTMQPTDGLADFQPGEHLDRGHFLLAVPKGPKPKKPEGGDAEGQKPCDPDG